MNNSSLIEIVRSFWLDPKEPKSQGSHCGGYGLGRCAKISENSLRSDSRDFLTLRSVDRFTPPPLGRNSGQLLQLKIENGELKIYKVGLHGKYNSPLSLGNASRGATGKNGGKHNKYIRYIVGFYWIV